jgi:hypothetical protein
LNAQDNKLKVIIAFELDSESIGSEEFDIVATVLAELLGDAEALLRRPHQDSTVQSMSDQT